ncbi:MAG: hypothetical protein CMLOHMNK_03335 [Steroidobacteraceae bacterium]|nr:hypothetical protein [Steroidobacteraceae bacterium]
MKTISIIATVVMLGVLYLAAMAHKIDEATVEGIALGLSLEECNSAKGTPDRTERVPPADMWAFYPDELSVRFSMNPNGGWSVNEVWGASLEEAGRVIVRRGMSVAQVKQVLGPPLSQQEGPKNSILMVYALPTKRHSLMIQFFGDNVGFVGVSTVKSGIPGFRHREG